MEVFISVTEMKGFSAAARTMRMTPSAVSKLIGRLETRLGARLVNRSTRAFELTAEGLTFYEKAKKILADIQNAELEISAGQQPSGHIRISTSASYSAHILEPALPRFIELYPEVTLDLIHTDRIVDMHNERTDIAVRAGPLQSSSLVARKLGETANIIVTSPQYLSSHGKPETIDDLNRHICLGFSYERAVNGWPLKAEGSAGLVHKRSHVRASDGEGLRRLALQGIGLARLAKFTVEHDIRVGRLVPLLEEFNPGDMEEFHAIYIGQGGPLPSRIRAMLDFLAGFGKVSTRSSST